MTRRITFPLLLSFNILIGLVDVSVAFSLVGPTTTGLSTIYQSGGPSTCLAAQEGDNEEDTTANNAAPPSNGDDILNSPAFLKRKLDVLRSDIAQTEQNIADAKVRLEDGKAEWGGQLDELQKEVRERERCC
jgi:hypothetical protein